MLKRRTVVLFDRYYPDLIADPGRSRIDLPMWLLAGAGRVLPLPDYCFFIRVAPEEVHRRKQELPLARIRELNARYDALAARGWLVPVANDGAPGAAAAAIVDHIVADRDRAARRALARARR